MKDCETFLGKIHTSIPTTTEDFRSYLQVSYDADFSAKEIKDALMSMEKGKSPGVNWLFIEFFFTHFWNLIQVLLTSMYKECISQGEMTVTMKQEVISIIPKPEKDPLIIDNWHPIHF